MGYRADLEQAPETVQDLALSADRRLKEATDLALTENSHSAIYLGGLAAEMFLKTACFQVDGARPGDLAQPRLAAAASKHYKPPFKTDFEHGHGLWFWSQELIARRRELGRPIPRRLIHVAAALYDDWFVSMRYRPGSATMEMAAAFIHNVEWIARNHAVLRS
jgi:hypothetical protein